MADNDRHDGRQAEARRILDHINTETAATGMPKARNVLDRTRDHFAGADAEPGDNAELWGRRIGRAISLVLFVVLVVWLIRFAAGS